MKETVRGWHQKYGDHAGSGQRAENYACKQGTLIAARLWNQRHWNETEDGG
jgi:hypothetical protein